MAVARAEPAKACEGAKAAKKQSDSGEEMVLVPEILPQGPVLRALMQGGAPAAKATKELHRRWDHMPEAEMKALFKRPNLDPALIKEIPKILEDCRICRMWQRLPARQIAKSAFAVRFNQRLWLDLFFCTIFCPGEPTDCTNLHMLDEATYLCLLPLLAGRSFAAIKNGFVNWSGVWGFPEECLADGESGIGSEQMKVWLANNHCSLLPVPPAKGSRHTQYGIVDNQSKAVRGTVHRVDSSLVERGVKASPEELFSNVAWTANTARGRTGHCAAQAAMGMVPRDALQTQVWDRMTTSQMNHEEQTLEKIKTKACLLYTSDAADE